MSNSIADKIENYLKQLLKASETGYIELQRQHLAEIFACVPSQINYVLSTRFTDSHGYIVETRRGGGGYIKIFKLTVSHAQLGKLFDEIGEELCQQTTEALIIRLYEEGLIKSREAKLMQAATNRDNLELQLPKRDQVRAKIFKAMLREIFRRT